MMDKTTFAQHSHCQHVSTWLESGHVDQRDQRNVEGIAEADKARALDGSVDVQHTCIVSSNNVSQLTASRRTGLVERLVGNNSNGAAIEASEANNQVLGVVGLHLKEVRLVHKLEERKSKLRKA